MHKSVRFLVAAGLIGGGCWLTSAWGQQDKSPDPTSAGVPVPLPTAPVALPNDGDARPNDYGVDGVGPQGPWESPNRGGKGFLRVMRDKGMRREAIEEAQAFQGAIYKLRSAKEGAEKEAAKKELLQCLEKSFTRDLDHREREVAEIESRVKKLREQIERRKKAKDEIVGLRLKTIVNETEGLGFPGPQDLEPTVKRPATYPAPGPVPPSFDAFSPRPAVVPDDGR
jgi:hypothetical protein